MPDRELIERLRRIASGDFADAQEGVRFQDVITGATDRIEELERQVDSIAESYARMKVARSKAIRQLGEAQEKITTIRHGTVARLCEERDRLETGRIRDAAVLEGLTKELASLATQCSNCDGSGVWQGDLPCPECNRNGFRGRLEHAQSSVEGGDNG